MKKLLFTLLFVLFTFSITGCDETANNITGDSPMPIESFGFDAADDIKLPDYEEMKKLHQQESTIKKRAERRRRMASRPRDVDSPAYRDWFKSNYPELYEVYKEDFGVVNDVWYKQRFLDMLIIGVDLDRALTIIKEKDIEHYERNKDFYEEVSETINDIMQGNTIEEPDRSSV